MHSFVGGSKSCRLEKKSTAYLTHAQVPDMSGAIKRFCIEELYGTRHVRHLWTHVTLHRWHFEYMTSSVFIDKIGSSEEKKKVV